MLSTAVLRDAEALQLQNLDSSSQSQLTRLLSQTCHMMKIANATCSPDRPWEIEGLPNLRKKVDQDPQSKGASVAARKGSNHAFHGHFCVRGLHKLRP